MASALLLAALALADPVGPAMVLDDLLAFSDSAQCIPAPPFRSVLESLWAQRHQQTNRSVAPKPYRAAFGQIGQLVGNDGVTMMSAPIRGSWHGLALSGIDIWSMPDGKPGFQLVFRAPADKVAATLAPLGFRDATAIVPDDAGSLSRPAAGLVSRQDLTALRCPLP